ncbi:MAG TPA: DUF4178 domain-containing protein, partial [Candidatus Methylomirabilis sp.]
SLLKEADPKQGRIRWFFTREIPEDAVAVEGGGLLTEWMEREHDPKPPSVLAYHQNSYRYEETTEGTHEDDAGQRVPKVTWDYWDGGHTHNLAVERWPDGSFECYLGRYIDPDQITIRPPDAGAVPRPRLGANPFLGAVILVPCAYFLAFVIGRPLDEGLAFSLVVAAAGGWMMAVRRAPAAGVAALAAALAAAAVFWRFPPLTTGPGLAVLFGAPAAIGWVARGRVPSEGRLAVLYAAAFGVAGPLLAVGLYEYFRFAPGPHGPDQLVLALGPAALGGLAACLVAGLMSRREA